MKIGIKNLVENNIISKHKNEMDTNAVYDLSQYRSLGECLSKTVDNISCDEVFAQAEYNLIGLWANINGLTEDDEIIAVSRGYEDSWFMEGARC